MNMYSCFVFEKKNEQLMKLIQGTQHVDKQLISAVSMIQKKAKLLSHCHDSMTPDGKALDRKDEINEPSHEKSYWVVSIYWVPPIVET